MEEMQNTESGVGVRNGDDCENNGNGEDRTISYGENDGNAADIPASSKYPHASQPLSKRAQKKLIKQQKCEAKKAEKKAVAKEQKRLDKERKRKEWDEKLSTVSEEEKSKMIEERKGVRKERMEKRSEERDRKIERLTKAKENGQNIIIDLEFSHLMTVTELRSLVQQIMYCYAVNSRCASPCHLWLTGCNGDMETQLDKLPGSDKWIMEKKSESYIEALQTLKDSLVYLTADAEKVLDDLDPKKMYIIGGLVDRNRWKGITMKKAMEQGIEAARLPIGNYVKMSSSQVLTVNQVMEILLKYLETRDWKDSFFQVIPQRKRCGADGDESGRFVVEERSEESNSLECAKKSKTTSSVEANDRDAEMVASLV